MIEYTNIREGKATDLTTVMDIWYRNEMADWGSDPATVPPPPPVLPEYQHLVKFGKLWVAERDGRVLGFSGVAVRDRVAFLTDLFVDPDYHSAGLGGQLLRSALGPHAGLIRCTIGSGDERALALYTRYGLQPQWPIFLLRSQGLASGRINAGAAVAREAPAGDPELLAWDAEVSGRMREVDHTFWVADEGGVPLWIERDGLQIGYAYVRLAAGVIGAPDTARVGPIGSRMAEDICDCALAAVRWAAAQAPVLRMDVLGPNAALAPLLEVGFQIRFVETVMLEAPEPFFDMQRYICSGGSLF
jgi:GNAT superfamily N-acetyltransferase